MALVVHDTLTLTTNNGESKIQLCIGDITKLPKQDEVDVLVVSAFPGKLLVNPVNPSKSVRKYNVCTRIMDGEEARLWHSYRLTLIRNS